MTRGTCSAITSSLPIPFCTLQTAPPGEDRRRGRDRRLGRGALGGDDPELARRDLARVGAGLDARGQLDRAGDPQAVLR